MGLCCIPGILACRRDIHRIKRPIKGFWILFRDRLRMRGFGFRIGNWYLITGGGRINLKNGWKRKQILDGGIRERMSGLRFLAFFFICFKKRWKEWYIWNQLWLFHWANRNI